MRCFKDTCQGLYGGAGPTLSPWSVSGCLAWGPCRPRVGAQRQREAQDADREVGAEFMTPPPVLS